MNNQTPETVSEDLSSEESIRQNLASQLVDRANKIGAVFITDDMDHLQVAKQCVAAAFQQRPIIDLRTPKAKRKVVNEEAN